MPAAAAAGTPSAFPDLRPPGGTGHGPRPPAPGAGAPPAFATQRPTWPVPRPGGARRPDGSGYGGSVEIFYTGLLVLVAIVITWFAVYVVYRLLHEDK